MKKIGLALILLIAVYFLFIKGGSGPEVSQNGISPLKLSDDIFNKYNIDLDQNLNVTSESFLRTETEGVTKVESRGLLFMDADAFGNKDGNVSPLELTTYLQEFDTDNDSELTSYKNIFHSIVNSKSEWDVFEEQYGEKYKYN